MAALLQPTTASYKNCRKPGADVKHMATLHCSSLCTFVPRHLAWSMHKAPWKQPDHLQWHQYIGNPLHED